MRFSNFLVQFFSDSKKILIRELQEIREFLIWRKKEAELKILIILRQPLGFNIKILLLLYKYIRLIFYYSFILLFFNLEY